MTMASMEREALERMYLVERKSIPDISALTGVSQSSVRLLIIRFGIAMRSRREGILAAAHKLGSGNRGKTRGFSEEWKSNLRAGIAKSPRVLNAKGTALKPSGYVEYTTGPNKGRSVHVVTMEAHIGRHLRGDEVVHHRDENRSNNDLSNLQLMTRAEHTSHHSTTNLKNRERKENGQFK